MTIRGRSMDDLPLAAYTKGIEPDPRLAASEIAAPSQIAPAVDESSMADPGPADGEPLPASARPAVALPEWLGKPREHLHDPRLLLTGVIAVGVVLLALSLLTGGGPPSGPAAAGASPSAPVFLATAAPPAGDASVEVTGKLAASYALTGRTGIGPAAQSRIEASWGAASGATLGLSGPATAGTRTTAADFVLTWIVFVDDVPVTFTSKAGECTVGMAVQPKSVTGSFTCKKLKSDDGKQVVDARGTYRT